MCTTTIMDGKGRGSPGVRVFVPHAASLDAALKHWWWAVEAAVVQLH